MDSAKRLAGIVSKAGYKKNWFKDWFGEEYLAVYGHRDEADADKLIRLIMKHLPLSSEQLILDVACGNARHANLLARKNLRVVGVDLSRFLLRQASTNVQAKKYPLLVQADMRHLPFHPQFDVILSMFTSFGYFESDSENEAVLAEFAALLFDAGVLVIDFLNRQHVIEHLVPSSRKKTMGMDVEELRYIDNERVHKQIKVRKGKEQRVFHESVRLFTCSEIEKMLNSCRLNVISTFGDYDGQPYEENSNRMIIFAQKAKSTDKII